MTLQAGTARTDISPIKPLQLFGYPNVTRISSGTHDPLYASAIYLHNGTAGAAIVSLDILQLTPVMSRRLCATIARDLAVAPEAVFLSCTHTHSGPVTTQFIAWKGDMGLPDPDAEYLAHVERQAIAAAQAAKAAARPAELAWTTADATGVGGNRLQHGGPADPEVGLLAIRPAGGGPLFGLVLVHSMHPTVIHEDITLATSDIPGFARMHLERVVGPHLVTACYMGTAGNQSPRYYVTGQTFAEAERLGTMLGTAVEHALAALPASAYRADATIAACVQSVVLKRRPIPALADAERTLAEYRATYERLKRENAGHGPIRTAECAVFGAEGTVALAKAEASGVMAKAIPDYSPAQLQALRIGDCVLVGWPGEHFVEYGLELKRRAPRKAFVAALVGGEIQGYIVTPEAAAAGGYEATNAVFAPDNGKLFIDTSLQQIATLG
jgi:neutral ceramidase